MVWGPTDRDLAVNFEGRIGSLRRRAMSTGIEVLGMEGEEIE